MGRSDSLVPKKSRIKLALDFAKESGHLGASFGLIVALLVSRCGLRRLVAIMLHIIFLFCAQAQPLSAIRFRSQVGRAVVLKADALDTHPSVAVFSLKSVKDDKVLVLDAAHDARSTRTHNVSHAISLEEDLGGLFVRSKDAVARDDIRGGVVTLGECAGGEKENVGAAGRVIEEVRRFDEVGMIVLAWRLKRVHFADE